MLYIAETILHASFTRSRSTRVTLSVFERFTRGTSVACSRLLSVRLLLESHVCIRLLDGSRIFPVGFREFHGRPIPFKRQKGHCFLCHIRVLHALRCLLFRFARSSFPYGQGVDK